MDKRIDEQDREWLTRLRAREAAAFGQLVECYERPLFNVAWRMLGDAGEAADVTQEVFLKVFQRIDSYDPNCRLFSWIYRIAINAALDRLRQRQRMRAMALAMDDLPLPRTERAPWEEAQDGQTHVLIQSSLMELQRDYRAVIVLRHFSGCSYRQMADILHIPEKTVRSRLYGARQALRAKLCTRGVTHA